LLLLVAVTIAMAVDGGLFGKATEAGAATNTSRQEEENLAKGLVNFTYNGKTYTTDVDKVDDKILELDKAAQEAAKQEN